MQNERRKDSRSQRLCSGFCIHHSAFCISPMTRRLLNLLTVFSLLLSAAVVITVCAHGRPGGHVFSFLHRRFARGVTEAAVWRVRELRAKGRLRASWHTVADRTGAATKVLVVHAGRTPLTEFADNVRASVYAARTDAPPWVPPVTGPRHRSAGLRVPFPAVARRGSPRPRPASDIIRWRRQRFTAHRGQCPPCGYSHTANVSGVCPECGNQMQNAKRQCRCGRTLIAERLSSGFCIHHSAFCISP